MGELVLAAKITHVPSMYLSELPGPHQGCRKAAIDGHREISRRARERGLRKAMRTRAGRAIISARRRKGRTRLSA